MDRINTITRVSGATVGTQVTTITDGPAILESIHLAQTPNGSTTITNGATGSTVMIIGTTPMIGTHWVQSMFSGGIAVQFSTASAANEISVIWRH